VRSHVGEESQPCIALAEAIQFCGKRIGIGFDDRGAPVGQRCACAQATLDVVQAVLAEFGSQFGERGPSDEDGVQRREGVVDEAGQRQFFALDPAAGRRPLIEQAHLEAALG
jgi:hypothetical protein